jgi:kynurenine formamidase
MEIPSVGSDTIATEQTNHEESGTMIPLHMALLHYQGVIFNEIDWTHDLAEDCAKDGQYTFLFVGAPLKVVGGAGSPVNPIVIK